jgi:hypothetical protein
MGELMEIGSNFIFITGLNQWFPKRVVDPLGAEDYPGGAKRGKKSGEGELEVGPSERVDRLLTTGVTLDQTSVNWYHAIKPIHPNKNLLRMRYLLSVVTYFLLCKTFLKNAFYKVWHGALRMSLWNQGDGGAKKSGNHRSKRTQIH